MGLLDKLRGGLAKTRDVLAGGLRKVLFLGRTLDEALITDLEEVLIKADVGPKTTAGLLDELRAAWKSGEVKKSEEVAPFLEKRVAERLRQGGNAIVAALSLIHI